MEQTIDMAITIIKIIYNVNILPAMLALKKKLEK